MGPIALLRNGNYCRVWIAGAIGGTLRWLETLAISVYVFDLTGSPFMVALMVFARLAPTILFGALIGAVALGAFWPASAGLLRSAHGGVCS